ncbi:MAG: hypothetical protein WD749_11745 [Phycisphaerales bacterium]
MPARPGTRNNLIAGLFVIASTVLAVVISIIVSGAQKRLIPTNRYVVRFSLEDGAFGVKRGSIVSLGGQEVGRVTGVEFAYAPGGQASAVDVHIAVRSSVTLYEDAWAFLERPLLGTISTLNIPSAGTGAVAQHRGTGPILEEGEVLPGRLAAPAFLAQAGWGPKQIAEFQVILTETSRLVTNLERITTRFDAEIDPTIAAFRGVVSDVSSVTSEFRQKMPAWTRGVDEFLAKTHESAARLNAALDTAEGAVRDLREIVAANRPSVERSIANIEEATARFNRESMPLLNEALDKSARGAEEFAGSAARFSALLARELPSIEHTLANLRLASEQIRLTGIEVRRNPWRILYQPSRKELESELFYSAARTYAHAVSDLRAASEALAAASAAPSALPEVQRESAAQLQQRLEEAFRLYQDAERALLKEMGEKSR